MKTPTRNRPANAAIADKIGTAIASGALAPGQVLPSEIELASHYSVSRTVIRESMRTLASKRLVESRQKAGTRVRPRSEWNLLDPDLLEWMFEGTPSEALVADLFQLRMIVEPAAAELAATFRTAGQLSRMGYALEMMAIHGLGSEEGQQADQQFHRVLFEASGNELIASLSYAISSAVRLTTAFKHRGNKRLRDSLPLHRDLHEAIADGNADCAREAALALLKQARLDFELSLG